MSLRRSSRRAAAEATAAMATPKKNTRRKTVSKSTKEEKIGEKEDKKVLTEKSNTIPEVIEEKVVQESSKAKIEVAKVISQANEPSELVTESPEKRPPATEKVFYSSTHKTVYDRIRQRSQESSPERAYRALSGS